jgi:hypothetical protein
MNGTRWTIRPAMKATSRERRSSLATTTGQTGKGGRQLRPSIESICSLSGFDLGELLDNGNALGLGEAGHRRTLRLDAQSRTTLLLCGTL